MKVRQFILDVMEANAFLAWCEETRSAFLIDCGAFPKEIAEVIRAENLKLDAVFITHGHHDHIEGLPEALHAFPVPVYAAAPLPGVKNLRRIAHGDAINLGACEGRVVSTPGHTPDGVSLIFPGHVFTGDALFAGSVGGTGAPELAEQQLNAIRQHLFALDGDTIAHVGHGPATTIEIERRHNPFFT